MTLTLNHKYITYHNAVKGGPSHITSNMHKKLVNSGCAVFKLCERTDRQTD